MLRRVLAIVAVGLLVSGLFGGVLARKPPIRGKGSPTQFGDPDWPAYMRVTEDRQQVAIRFGNELVSPDGVATPQTQPRPMSHDWRKHRRPSRRYVLRILGRTIVIRR